MTRKTWLPTPKRPAARPLVAEEVRDSIEAELSPLLAELRQRLRRSREGRRINQPIDVSAHWYRQALYLVVTYKSLHGRPETFDVKIARMEHVGEGKFQIGLPMRRGWNVHKDKLTPQQCIERIRECVFF